VKTLAAVFVLAASALVVAGSDAELRVQEQGRPFAHHLLYLPNGKYLRLASLGNAPLAVKFALESVNKGLETSQAEGLVMESSFFAICAATEDKKEGTSAFLEKRAPKFAGR